MRRTRASDSFNGLTRRERFREPYASASPAQIVAIAGFPPPMVTHTDKHNSVYIGPLHIQSTELLAVNKAIEIALGSNNEYSIIFSDSLSSVEALKNNGIFQK